MSSNVSVGTVVVAQMGGWGTKGCSRGGIILGRTAAMARWVPLQRHTLWYSSLYLRRFAIPHGQKILASCPHALNKNRSRINWASLVEGSILLVSACKVAAPNVEGSGLTDVGRGQWQRQKCAPGIISILLNRLTRSFTVTVPPMATAGEEREAHCSL